MSNFTPHQAYVRTAKLAKAAKQSMRTYCFERGVNHSTVCKWKNKKTGTVFNSIAEKLNGPPAKSKSRDK